MSKLVARKSKSFHSPPVVRAMNFMKFTQVDLSWISRTRRHRTDHKPSKICGISTFTGTLDTGKIANFHYQWKTYFRKTSTSSAGLGNAVYNIQPKEDANKTTTISNKINFSQTTQVQNEDQSTNLI